MLGGTSPAFSSEHCDLRSHMAFFSYVYLFFLSRITILAIYCGIIQETQRRQWRDRRAEDNTDLVGRWRALVALRKSLLARPYFPTKKK